MLESYAYGIMAAKKRKAQVSTGAHENSANMQFQKQLIKAVLLSRARLLLFLYVVLSASSKVVVCDHSAKT